MIKFKKSPALTLLEVFLVITIFAVLIVAVTPNMIIFFFSNQSTLAEQEVVHTLRHSREKAATQIHDSSWGVYFDTGASTYTLFSGSTYVGRDASLDVDYPLPGSVTFGTITLTGGGTEVVFDQITGNTSQDGTVEITSASDPTITVTINAFGNVSSN